MNYYDTEIRGDNDTVYLPKDKQSANIYGPNMTVITSGDGVGIATDAESGTDALIVATGKDAQFYVSAKAVVHSSGDSSNAYVQSDEESEPVIDGAAFHFSGTGAEITTNNGVKNATVILSGDGSQINDVSPFDSRNTFVLTGDESFAYSYYVSSTIMATGNGTNIIMGQIHEEHPDIKGGVAMLSGTDCYLVVAPETVGFCAHNPVSVTLREGGAVAIGWNDGTRERVSVFYEGENGIEADVEYTMNVQGQLVKI